MKVNLAPYKDFRELSKKGIADYSMVKKVDSKVKEIQQRRDLKQATYGSNATLGMMTL